MITNGINAKQFLTDSKKIIMTTLEVLPSELTQEVMSMAELHHARIPIPSAFCFGLGEWLRRPFFVMAGAEGAVTMAAIWLAVIGALAALTLGIQIPYIGESREQQVRLFQLLAVVITASFVLTHPSRLAFLHVKPNAVHEVAGRCIQLQMASQFDLDACDRILNVAEKICGRRLSVLWFFPAAGWAISIYLVQRGLEADAPNLTAGLMAAIITLLLAGTVAAYSRSVWAVLGLSSAVIELQRKRTQAQR